MQPDRAAVNANPMWWRFFIPVLAILVWFFFNNPSLPPITSPPITGPGAGLTPTHYLGECSALFGALTIDLMVERGMLSDNSYVYSCGISQFTPLNISSLIFDQNLLLVATQMHWCMAAQISSYPRDLTTDANTCPTAQVILDSIGPAPLTPENALDGGIMNSRALFTQPTQTNNYCRCCGSGSGSNCLNGLEYTGTLSATPAPQDANGCRCDTALYGTRQAPNNNWTYRQDSWANPLSPTHWQTFVNDHFGPQEGMRMVLINYCQYFLEQQIVDNFIMDADYFTSGCKSMTSTNTNNATATNNNKHKKKKNHTVGDGDAYDHEETYALLTGITNLNTVTEPILSFSLCSPFFATPTRAKCIDVLWDPLYTGWEHTPFQIQTVWWLQDGENASVLTESSPDGTDAGAAAGGPNIAERPSPSHTLVTRRDWDKMNARKNVTTNCAEEYDNAVATCTKVAHEKYPTSERPSSCPKNVKKGEPVDPKCAAWRQKWKDTYKKYQEVFQECLETDNDPTMDAERRRHYQPKYNKACGVTSKIKR